MEENKRRASGFTLTELLIVVAVIAILAMISIPIFTSRMETAKKNTCLYNRKSLQKVLQAYEVEGKPIDLTDEAAMRKLVASMGVDGAEFKGGKITGMCPEGNFAVSQKNGVYQVTCLKHSDEVHTFLSAFFNNSKIKSNIDAYFKRNPTSGAIDSTGTTGTELKDELIKSLNISDPFDFRIEKDGSDFYIYIFEPLEKVTTGTEIAVTKYKMKNNGEINGTPTEENCKVAEKPNPNTPGNKMKYIVTSGK